jgi:hypothetical protein
MSDFPRRKIVRTAGLAVALLFTLNATAAFAQASEAEGIRNQVGELITNYPGSSIVYFGCEAVAEQTYKSRQNLSDGLATLATCGAIGCALADSYKDCLEVDAELFVLHLRLEALS